MAVALCMSAATHGEPEEHAMMKIYRLPLAGPAGSTTPPEAWQECSAAWMHPASASSSWRH